MKNLKTFAVRIVVAFVLLTAAVIVIETQTGANKAYATGGEGGLCGVSDAQCVNYLIAKRYTNVTVISYSGCDRICDTSNPYHTIVHVSNGFITGSDDMPN